MTYINYGSCSGCDTLLSLQCDYSNDAAKTKIKGFICLCKDILMNTIKPYNSGWRKEEEWDPIKWDGNF